MSTKSFVRPEDIERHPVDYLINNGSDSPAVQHCTDFYFRRVAQQRKNGQVEITKIGFEPSHIWFLLLGVKPPTSRFVDDPLPLLNHLLYQVMKTGQTDFVIPSQIVWGFSGCGRGFYEAFSWSFKTGKLLSPDITYPPHLVVQRANGSYWTRIPESGTEQLYHFIYSLRQCIEHLAEQPIGKRSTLSTTEIAHNLTQLERRSALVRAGTESSLMHTYDTLPTLQGPMLAERLATIQAQTRQRYCRPKAEVESGTSMAQTAEEPQVLRWEARED